MYRLDSHAVNGKVAPVKSRGAVRDWATSSLPRGTISQEVLLVLATFADDHLHICFPAKRMQGWPAGSGTKMTTDQVAKSVAYIERLGLITCFAPDIYQINYPAIGEVQS
jgi:hypothetical protein